MRGSSRGGQLWGIAALCGLAALAGEKGTSGDDQPAGVEHRMRRVLAGADLACLDEEAARPLALGRLALLEPSSGPTASLTTQAADLLERLARSETHDHLGGGFFEPECRGGALRSGFDKRLATNALLLDAFVRGYGKTQILLFREVADQTIAFLVRDLRSSSGAFFSGIRAGSPEAGARHYLWTEEEVRRFLGRDRAREFLSTYELREGRLRLAGDPFAGLASSRGVLLFRRGRRVKLEVDTRIDGTGNGLAIGSLARAGRLLGRGFATEAGRRAADAVPGTRLSPEGKVSLAAGLLELHRATSEPEWQASAVVLVDEVVRDQCRVVAGKAAEHLVCSWDAAPGGTARSAALLSVLLRLGAEVGARYSRLAQRLEIALREDLMPGSAAEEALQLALWSAKD
jgi:uncharacterized protein YyaL (SSP411 family)